MDLSDIDDLIEDARQDDAAARESLVTLIGTFAYKYFVLAGLPSAEADEPALQVARYIVGRMLRPDFNHPNPTAWMRTIFRLRLRNKRRPMVWIEQVAESELGAQGSPIDTLEPVAPPTLSEEARAAIERVLATLKPIEGQILQLRILNATMSHREIGEVVGRNEGTVRVMLLRILRKLKQQLERDPNLADWLRQHGLEPPESRAA